MYHFDVYDTFFATTLVLLFGRKLLQSIAFLKRYAIPESVAGGIFVALMLLFLRIIFDWSITFELSLQEPMMLAFFSTVGLNANFINLKVGGKTLLIFIFVVFGLLIVQNMVGIILSNFLGLNPLIGLLAGSVTLSGGHGTGGAWSKIFSEHYGFQNANEVAMACATFGLVFGGLIGGPIVRFLMRNMKKSSFTENFNNIKEKSILFETIEKRQFISFLIFIETLAMIAICIVVGKFFSYWLGLSYQFTLPAFVSVLFTGVILSNILPFLGYHKNFKHVVSFLGNVSLSLFLGMALISLKLWELASLAIPILIILIIQGIVMGLYVIFVTFPIMGRNYDAAVLAAGHCGFGLGATPTAIANMEAITKQFGPSHLAFLVVPMVGAFFIDIINALVIKFYLWLPIFHLL
ncbi:sodium/glutamate symporter [Arsenophonus symbiont of Ornithomya chloropus]|uniref:sodium/glutamate symporter n=1 Tax=Arsenophonus symbiont of Ornithomya chloropus TaxID=634121 RepID=UPI0032B26166